MMISAEYLAEIRQRAEAERQRLIALVNQATGAIGIIDVLIARQVETEPEKAPETDKPD